MLKPQYGIIPPGETIAVHLNPPLQRGDEVKVIALPPQSVVMQIVKADSVVLSNTHAKWPLAFTLLVIRAPALPTEGSEP